MRWVLTGILLGVLVGCRQGPVLHEQSQEKGAGEIADSVVAASVSTDTMPLLIEDERTFDLTGDGHAELIRLIARGATYDSLEVTLEIRTAADSLLYRDQWNSIYYFQYDPREGKADSTVERIVRGHLEDVFLDRAFNSSDTGLDDEALEFELKQMQWRRDHALPDSAELPSEAYSEIFALKVPPERLAELRAELTGKPSFTYFSGGEATQTIAWSQSLKRFVLTFSCC